MCLSILSLLLNLQASTRLLITHTLRIVPTLGFEMANGQFIVERRPVATLVMYYCGRLIVLGLNLQLVPTLLVVFHHPVTKENIVFHLAWHQPGQERKVSSTFNQWVAYFESSVCIQCGCLGLLGYSAYFILCYPVGKRSFVLPA